MAEPTQFRDESLPLIHKTNRLLADVQKTNEATLQALKGQTETLKKASEHVADNIVDQTTALSELEIITRIAEMEAMNALVGEEEKLILQEGSADSDDVRTLEAHFKTSAGEIEALRTRRVRELAKPAFLLLEQDLESEIEPRIHELNDVLQDCVEVTQEVVEARETAMRGVIAESQVAIEAFMGQRKAVREAVTSIQTDPERLPTPDGGAAFAIPFFIVEVVDVEGRQEEGVVPPSTVFSQAQGWGFLLQPVGALAAVTTAFQRRLTEIKRLLSSSRDRKAVAASTLLRSVVPAGRMSTWAWRSLERKLAGQSVELIDGAGPGSSLRSLFDRHRAEEPPPARDDGASPWAKEGSPPPLGPPASSGGAGAGADSVATAPGQPAAVPADARPPAEPAPKPGAPAIAVPAVGSPKAEGGNGQKTLDAAPNQDHDELIATARADNPATSETSRPPSGERQPPVEAPETPPAAGAAPTAALVTPAENTAGADGTRTRPAESPSAVAGDATALQDAPTVLPEAAAARREAPAPRTDGETELPEVAAVAPVVRPTQAKTPAADAGAPDGSVGPVDARAENPETAPLPAALAPSPADAPAEPEPPVPELLGAAVELAKAHRFIDSVQLLERLIEEGNQDERVRRLRYFCLEQLESEAADPAPAVAPAPVSPTPEERFDEAAALAQKRQFQEAIVIFEELISEGHDVERAQRFRGLCLDELDRESEGAAVAPSEPGGQETDTRLATAIGLAQSRSFREAVVIFEELIAEGSDDERIRRFRDICLDELEKEMGVGGGA